jgi:hypothetical protein
VSWFSRSLLRSIVTSGTTDGLTIAVKDAAGSPIRGLTSNAFATVFAGGTSGGKISAVMPTSTPGTYFATFTGVLAGSATPLEIEVNGVSLSIPPTVQVNPGFAYAAKSTAGFANPTVVSGKMDILTITVKDANGNPITKLTDIDFVLSLLGGTSSGSFGTVMETKTPGTYAMIFTGEFADTTTYLSVTVSGVLFSKKLKVTVTA